MLDCFAKNTITHKEMTSLDYLFFSQMFKHALHNQTLIIEQCTFLCKIAQKIQSFIHYEKDTVRIAVLLNVLLRE